MTWFLGLVVTVVALHYNYLKQSDSFNHSRTAIKTKFIVGVVIVVGFCASCTNSRGMLLLLEQWKFVFLSFLLLTNYNSASGWIVGLVVAVLEAEGYDFMDPP
jgi:hypothetical protein